MWNISRKLAGYERTVLYHQAASVQGGEIMRLRKLCLKGGMSQQKALLSMLIAAWIWPWTRQRLNSERDRWKRGQSSDCSWACLLSDGESGEWQTNTTSQWTTFLRLSLPLIFYVCLRGLVVCLSARSHACMCVCLSVHACVFTAWYCSHKVLCACALTLTQEIKRWIASGQVIQSTDDECSSVWK